MPTTDKADPAATTSLGSASFAGAMTALLESAAALVAQSLRADWGVVAQLSDDGLSLDQRAAAGTRRASRVTPCVPQASLCAYALQVENATASSDLASDARFGDEFLAELGCSSGLAAPLTCSGISIGAMAIGNRTARTYTLDEMYVLEEVIERLDALTARCIGEQAARPFLPASDEQAASTADPLDCESRTSRRHRYPFLQKIAPLLPGRLPTRGEFVDAQCRDISTGGLSLLLPTRPQTEQFVVALGRAAAVAYFVARVVHVRQRTLRDRVVYEVGCQFLGRIDL